MQPVSVWPHRSSHVDLTFVVLVPILNILPQFKPPALRNVICNLCMVPYRLFVQVNVIVLN